MDKCLFTTDYFNVFAFEETMANVGFTIVTVDLDVAVFARGTEGVSRRALMLPYATGAHSFHYLSFDLFPSSISPFMVL